MYIISLIRKTNGITLIEGNTIESVINSVKMIFYYHPKEFIAATLPYKATIQKTKYGTTVIDKAIPYEVMKTFTLETRLRINKVIC
jgi:hypothetical protein